MLRSHVIFPFLFLVCYNGANFYGADLYVIFPFLFLVCYNIVPHGKLLGVVIFPFLFLVCYNFICIRAMTLQSYFPFYSWYVIIRSAALSKFECHISLFILGML